MTMLPHDFIESIIVGFIRDGRMKFLTDILTGPDNSSYDNGRVICLATFFVYFFLAFFAAFSGHEWTPLDFAGGAACMAAGFGANLHLKRLTEPKPRDHSNSANPDLSAQAHNQVGANRLADTLQ